jgi:hypothetical protein
MRNGPPAIRKRLNGGPPTNRGALDIFHEENEDNLRTAAKKTTVAEPASWLIEISKRKPIYEHFPA